MSYIWVGVLTGCQVTAWIGWFIVEIIIHSLNSDYSVGDYLQLEITQSMQIYQYEGVILAGTITALHLAASVKTRAARVGSFVVQMFAFLAWFWELYFIIPTFRSTSDPTNLFCTTFSPSPIVSFTAPTSTCHLARAVAAFAVIMQFFQSIIVLYSFINMFIPPRIQDRTRKEIIEEDDAEVATVVSTNPAAFQQINARVGMYSYASLSMVLLSITGYALMMYALIDVVRFTGFQMTGNVLGSNNAIQLGDALLSVNFRQLSIVLVFSLTTSAYACFRHNRGIQAGALFLTAITMLQWWSWIIEGGRYLWQYHPDGNPDTGETGNPYPNLNAQDAMYAGACCIVAGETIRTIFLLLRYYSYVPVTRNNVIPTYIRGAFATANPITVILFWCEVAVTIAWFVLQFVHESDSGIFNYQNAPVNIPLANMVTDTLFIWQTLFFVAVWIPELFSERTKTLASKQAALAVNITVICAWWLLMWPWTYATIYTSGSWEAGFSYGPGIPGVPGSNFIPGFCVESAYGHDNCQLAQGAAILSVISGSGYLFLSFYQLARILSMLPTPGQVATIDGTVVDALPPTVAIQKALGWNSGLVLVGLLIWALAGINSGSSVSGFISFTFGQLIGTPGIVTYLPSYLLSYSYSVAFGMLIIIGFTVWSASELAANPVVANWHAWRTLVSGLSGLLFTFFIPFFIIICRYINWNIGISSSGGLNPTELAIAAGIIIMCIGEYALYGAALIAQKSPLIALPAAINNTSLPSKPQDMTGVTVLQPGTGAATGTASTEPTVVTTTAAIPGTEYSGTQQPVPAPTQ